MKRWFRWELMLTIVMFFVFTYGAAADGLRAQVSGKLLRLHVIANSDSEQDQALKLKVRDRILVLTAPLLADAEDEAEVQKILRENMQEIVEEAQRVVWENGSRDAVSATIQKEYYPTKAYAGFSLPAGEYRGLKIRIGEAKGRNWWCVVFPPLCLSAAGGEQLQSSAGLSQEEAGFINQDGAQYVVKFKAAELFGELRNWL